MPNFCKNNCNVISSQIELNKQPAAIASTNFIWIRQKIQRLVRINLSNEYTPINLFIIMNITNQQVIYYPEQGFNNQTAQYFNNPPSQPFETLQFTPNCMSICFMMPFPFFCIGCCISQTTKFNFDNNNRNLIVKTYCGYCCCLGSTLNIPYDEILNVDVRLRPGVRINHRPAYKVWLLYRRGEIELSGSILIKEARDIENKIKTVMARCSIAAGQAKSKPVNDYMITMEGAY